VARRDTELRGGPLFEGRGMARIRTPYELEERP